MTNPRGTIQGTTQQGTTQRNTQPGEGTPGKSDPERAPDTDKLCHGLCKHWQKALLCIDLQYLNCAENYGVFDDHHRWGISDESKTYYLDRVNRIVLPNVQALQQAFRDKGFEVIHIRIQSLTRDGRDRSLEHKNLGLHAPPGSKQAEFLPQVAPRGDEIVINKTASGVFNATNLEYILRNLCVSEVYVAGVYTNECISTAVRGASDLGFLVYLVTDGTAALTEALHDATVVTTRDRYANVVDTRQVLAELNGA